ncbi:D-Ala-D-Ala carboxypeptidase family metallohydrolase [Trinickia diaoshuihuensis]|uniref:D-Ala-D-Ala carboxypeptidase family metallohydrolase n=1 Tax=Trinickia diaoshuihuensis TaxID=2292265 RepID=UPI0013C31224|nr:D-Ala-D-Ala carboxypeptidase family metallohydrolase [Trinickia diaoshuihuensis]
MLGRRAFCKSFAAAVAVAPFIAPARALEAADVAPPTLLWLRRGSDEAMIDYSTDQGFSAVAWMLRDVRAGVVGVPEWRLLQQWSWMQAWLAAYGRHVRFDIHSGLRTKETNAHYEGALASYHLPDARGVFRAGDFSTPSIPSEYMGRLAYLSQQGGVGLYARDFIHTDVRGRTLAWRSR